MSSTDDRPRRERVLVTAEQADQLEELLHAVARWIAGEPFFDGEEPTEPAEPPSRARRAVTMAGKILAGAAIVAVNASVAVARVDAQRPDNWPGLVGYTEAVRLVADGFPVLWVPDQDTLSALAEAPNRPARQRVLLARRDRVLSHARAVLAEVQSTDLQPARMLAEQVLDCVTQFPFPAQSLALQIVALVTLRETGSPTFTRLRERLDAELSKLAAPSGMALTKDLGTTFMLLAAAPALDQFYPDHGDPVPTRPNRHAISHVLSLEQYTEANALESALLAVSVLRQAESAQAERLAAASADVVSA